MIKKSFIAKHTRTLLTLLGTVFIALGGNAFSKRSPKRSTPKNAKVVSPAHGTIASIVEITSDKTCFLKKGVTNTLELHGLDLPLTAIIIELSLLNVHVQRAPISGNIVACKHTSGKHDNAYYVPDGEEYQQQNEKQLVIFENDDITVGVIQVAGLLARRIMLDVHTKSSIEQGDVYGSILLGSQVLILVPAKEKVKVSVGDTVVDGETSIC